jgi:hypothetical protein
MSRSAYCPEREYLRSDARSINLFSLPAIRSKSKFTSLLRDLARLPVQLQALMNIKTMIGTRHTLDKGGDVRSDFISTYPTHLPSVIRLAAT